jgi:hypothetical protein
MWFLSVNPMGPPESVRHAVAVCYCRTVPRPALGYTVSRQGTKEGYWALPGVGER